MPEYLRKTSLIDFLNYYADEADTVTFVDLEENRAFGWDSGAIFLLHDIHEMLKDKEERFIALWRKKEQPADAANTDERLDG